MSAPASSVSEAPADVQRALRVIERSTFGVTEWQLSEAIGTKRANIRSIVVILTGLCPEVWEEDAGRIRVGFDRVLICEKPSRDLQLSRITGRR